MPTYLATIMLIARQELTINIRNRWTMIFAIAFGLLVLAISYFGMASTGYAMFQNFYRTSASLLNLVLYLIPMAALTMGTLSFAGEKGSSEILFSQPISRTQILLGKMAGLFCSILLSTLIGFGVCGAMIAMQAGAEGTLRYAGLVALSLVLALVFLSLAAWITMLSHRKYKAFGIALFVWFFLVLFYDLLIIGGTLFLEGKAARIFLFLSLFGNPVDLVRIASLIVLNGASVFGAAGATLVRFLGGPWVSLLWIGVMLAAWVVVPLCLAIHRLNREDI